MKMLSNPICTFILQFIYKAILILKLRWYNGSKDLAMNHVFEILSRIYHGKGWPEALKALPTRFITDRSQRFNKIK